MRKYWMFIGVAIIAGALALGAIACGDDDDDSNGAGAEPTATAQEAAPTEPPAGETPTDGETPADGVTIDVILEADPGYEDVAGAASITETAAGFDVEMTIDAGLEPGQHQNHIHAGTCASRGDVVVPLTALEADADGATTATLTSVDQQLSDFTAGANYFAVHAIDGTVVACGDIPAA